jgi:hypothetical protein
VNQYQIRTVLLPLFHGFATGICLRHNLEAACVLQQRRNSGAHDRVVIGNDNPKLVRWTSRDAVHLLPFAPDAT